MHTNNFANHPKKLLNDTKRSFTCDQCNYTSDSPSNLKTWGPLVLVRNDQKITFQAEVVPTTALVIEPVHLHHGSSNILLIHFWDTLYTFRSSNDHMDQVRHDLRLMIWPLQLCSLTPWLAHQRGPSLFACPRVWSFLIVFSHFYTRGHQRAECDILSRLLVVEIFLIFWGWKYWARKRMVSLAKNANTYNLKYFGKVVLQAKLFVKGVLLKLQQVFFCKCVCSYMPLT